MIHLPDGGERAQLRHLTNWSAEVLDDPGLSTDERIRIIAELLTSMRQLLDQFLQAQPPPAAQRRPAA